MPLDDPRRFSTDPEQRVAYLRDLISGNPRVCVPLQFLALSLFTPVLVLPLGLLQWGRLRDPLGDMLEWLFFWPMWGLFPFSSYVAIEADAPSTSFGLVGVLGGVIFWSGLVAANAFATRRISPKFSYVAFVVLAAIALTALHALLRHAGYSLQLEGL